MAIFIVSCVDQNRCDYLKATVLKEIAEADRIELTSQSWLVSFTGSAEELKNKLNIVRNGNAGFVASVPDPIGIGPKDLALWIKSKQVGVCHGQRL